MTTADTEYPVRLNKFLAERLGLSRRQADEAILAGKVSVKKQGSDEAKIAKIGEHIDFFDEVCYNGKIVPQQVSFLYLKLNKPTGYVCSRRAQGDFPTVYSLLPAEYQGLKTVGRLDQNSEGLILFTNDGDFAYRMTHPSFQKIKIYQVELDRPLEPLHQQEIADFGIEIGDGVSRLGLMRLDETRKNWQVEMSEGRNRQIRRTFGALGYDVVRLRRLQFGPYQLDELQPGQYEEIRP